TRSRRDWSSDVCSSDLCGFDATDVDDVGTLGHHGAYTFKGRAFVPGGAFVVEGVRGAVDDRHGQKGVGVVGVAAQFQHRPTASCSWVCVCEGAGPTLVAGIRSVRASVLVMGIPSAPYWRSWTVSSFGPRPTL